MSIRVQLARFKRKLFQKPWLKDQRYPGYWCDTMLGAKPTFVVQIGSNDGKTGDPLNELFQKHIQWKGLFVEPVPYVFERLQETYSDTDRFACENVAISDKEEQLTFYWVDPKARQKLPDLPYWFDQLGSFNKDRIAEELDGKLVPYMLSEPVDCTTLPKLLQRNNVKRIDLLHIDTEGHDWVILSQLDLERYNPLFILFEYNHLSDEDVAAARQFLAPDYHLFDVGIDVFAVNRSVDSGVLNHLHEHMTELE